MSEYDVFEMLIASRVAKIEGPIFTTDAEGLFEAYLSKISPWHRQTYNCNCCRRFIEHYGGLVTIHDLGYTLPVLWGAYNHANEVPRFFHESVAKLIDKVEKAKVTGVFVNDAAQWGVPSNKPGPGSKFLGKVWTHLHGVPSRLPIQTSKVKSAEQEMAKKKEEYGMLQRALHEYPIEAAVQAVRVLEADVVDQSEKTLGIAKWFLALQQLKAKTVHREHCKNLIWAAVAKAPAGWCHIKSTMINTLLEDIVNGLPFETIKKRWDEKMHPLKYQRPKTVSEGNLKQANVVVDKLGAAGALQRRWAKLEEVKALWWSSDVRHCRWCPNPGEPAMEHHPDGGCEHQAVACPKCGNSLLNVATIASNIRCGNCYYVWRKGAFDHLMPKKPTIKPVQLPGQTIRWSEFLEVLKGVKKLEAYIGSGRLAFFALTTGPAEPKILQWEHPVAWYFYNGGSYASRWTLTPGWVKVNAVCKKPCHWDGEMSHQSEDVFFILDGARDIGTDQGLGLFPASLRSEYHGVRASIEAYSRGGKLTGEGTANGIALGTALTVLADGQEYVLLSQ